MNYNIIYRGSLKTCNFSCHYCPFATCTQEIQELEQDEKELLQFYEWVKKRENEKIGIFFTPYGEALTYPWYKNAISELSKTDHINKVAVQTNLSCDISWLKNTCPEKTGIWASCHPQQTDIFDFAKKCRLIYDMGINISAGIVGVKENFDSIKKLRQILPNEIYLWVNAYKDENNYYLKDDISFLKSIDPYFSYNLNPWPSLDKYCRSGETIFCVDEKGDAKPCHFQDKIIGNIYKNDPENFLKKRTCEINSCKCHIGYIHMYDLDLYNVFGEGILERVPKKFQAAEILS